MSTQRRINYILRALLCMLLTLGLLFGALPGAKLTARADGWTDWTSLFTQSGWYDSDQEEEEDADEVQVEEDGTYTSKEEVAAYLNEFGHLPDNYITKKEAQKLGWVSSEGNLDEVAPGKSIGGDRFGNYEGLLPEKKNRNFYECDIDFEGKYRGAKRIIFTNDGLIYYTEDHYQTFELLYGEE